MTAHNDFLRARMLRAKHQKPSYSPLADRPVAGDGAELAMAEDGVSSRTARSTWTATAATQASVPDSAIAQAQHRADRQSYDDMLRGVRPRR